MPQVLPPGAFGVSPQRPVDTISHAKVFPSPINPIVSTPNMYHHLLGFNGSFKTFHDKFTSSFSKPKIRQGKILELKELLRPGQVVQVCGGPLVGKSTFVKEVLADFCCQPGSHTVIQHHIMCQGLSSHLSVLAKLYEHLVIKEAPNEITPVHQIKAILGDWLTSHHVFVFHKCESLVNGYELYSFLDFLSDLSKTGTFTTIFTSYKPFPQQSNMHKLDIGMLDNSKDIQSLLSFYSNGNHGAQIPGYASVILRCNLCFPVAVRYFAQMYLQGKDALSPERVEDSIKRNCLSFLEDFLGSRLPEVENWLQTDKLKWIFLLSPTMDVSCSSDQLWSMTEESGWNETFVYLTENFAVSMDPGLRRLRFHPLLLLYFMKAMQCRKLILKGDWFEQSCNKIVKFLCGVLDKTEIVSRRHGNKFALFTCLLPEWCHMKSTIQMAVHRNDYEAYWKLAILGSNVLIKWSSEEAIDFYKAMYESCRQNGSRTRKETAVLEGCYAYALAQGRDCSWKEAREHFQSAIRVLMEGDCPFFTAKILSNYARMLTRQGKYTKANRYFHQSQNMLMLSVHRYGDVQFFVSDWQKEELAMTINIMKVIPTIFLGDNKKALEELHRIKYEMEVTNHYHFEYSTVLNLMGLAVERGKGDQDRSILYYKQSLEERLHLVNVCPKDLVVPYNNLAMLQFRRGETEKALQNLIKALAIQRRHGWKSYNTALTLTHLADIHVQLGCIQVAFNYYLQADDILRVTSKNHDLRLRLNMALAHTAITFEMMSSTSTALCHVPQPPTCNFTPTTQHQSNSCLTCKEKKDLVMGEASSHTCSSDCIAYLDRTLIGVKSVKYYFLEINLLARRSTGTLSDHGHGHLLSSLAHLIMLNFNNPDAVESYVGRMREIMTSYSWLVQELQKAEEERKSYINHIDKFFEYISHTDFRALDVKVLIGHLRSHCEFCRVRRSDFSESEWERIVSFFCLESEQRESQLRFEPVHAASCDSILQIHGPGQRPVEQSVEPSSTRQNSTDIYVKFGATGISGGSEVESGTDNPHSEDAYYLTDRKHVEVSESRKSSTSSSLSPMPNVAGVKHHSPTSSSNDESLRVSCLSVENNLLYCGTDGALDGQRSMEEASWNADCSPLLSNRMNNNNGQMSYEIARNVSSSMHSPHVECESRPLTSPQVPFNSNNNNSGQPTCLRSIDLQENLIRAFNKEKEDSLANGFADTGDINSNNCNKISMQEKRSTDETTAADSGLSQVEVTVRRQGRNAGLRVKKEPRPESGFVSDWDSCGNEIKSPELSNWHGANGKFPFLRCIEGNSRGRVMEYCRLTGLQERAVFHNPQQSAFPVECCGIAGSLPVASGIFNENFCVNNNGRTGGAVSSTRLVNDAATLYANLDNGISDKCSKMTLNDSLLSPVEQKVNKNQGGGRSTPDQDGGVCKKRLPTEEDERDVN